MYRMKILQIVIIVFSVWPAIGQKVAFGEVTKAELETTKDVQFPDANAVVLYRSVDSYLGNYIEVHERIKILNENGYESATVFIPYPEIKKVEGATYNLVDGQIVKTELDKDLIFEDELIKDVEFKKFTFPNVSVGSVLEYHYKTEYNNMFKIDLQYDIPIKREKVVVTNRSNVVGVQVIQNPRAFLDLNRIEEAKSTTFLATNVPALELENYVYDMDIYRSFLKVNLTALGDTFRFGNWESLGGVIIGVDEFGQGVKPKNFYKKDVEAIVGSVNDNLKKAEMLYDFVKEKVKWDKRYHYMPLQTTREAYFDEEGNSAEINILYISMLRSLGIKANPVLASTQLNGIPLTASLTAFNCVLVDLELGEKHFLIDVAHPNSSFHYIAPQFVNWQGLRIYPDDSFDWIQLAQSSMSTKSSIASVSLDDDLTFVGSVKERHNGHFAIETNHQLKDLGSNNMEDLISYKGKGLEILEVKASSNNSEETDVSFDFELESGVDDVEGKLYFSPMLFFALDVNPFQKEERNYAIDFGYPLKKQIMLTFTIPEGYVVESLPESSKMVVENLGYFLYRASTVGNTIQVMTVFEVDNSLLPYDKYAEIKEFFKVRMQKETEKVVLAKG